MTAETAPVGGCWVSWVPQRGDHAPMRVESHYYRRVDGVWTCAKCGAVR